MSRPARCWARRTFTRASLCAAQAVLFVSVRYGVAFLHEQAGQVLGEEGLH